MVEEGRISEETLPGEGARCPRLRKPMPMLAPHSADQAIATGKDASVIALTLDAGLQKFSKHWHATARSRGSGYFGRHHPRWTMRAAMCWRKFGSRIIR